MYQNDACKVMTGKARISYAHLTRPYAHDEKSDPKYSATFLIPKTDTATKAQLDAAIAAAIEAGKQGKWNGVVPPRVATPIWDGDGVRASGEPFGEEAKGCWVFTASSKQRPGIVDANIQPIIDENEIYSGMYARATIRFFAYASNGKKGIGVGLNNVQKLADGEPLGGRTSAEFDFGGGAPAYPPQGLPVQPAAPQYAPQHAPQAPQAAPTYNYAAPAPAQPQAAPAPQYAPQDAPAINPITGQPINGGILGV